MTDLMTSRYGRRTRVRWWPIALAGTLAAGLLVWLVWAVWAQSTPEVTSGQTSYHIADHWATTTIEVHLRSPSVRATCEIQATASDHEVVGDLRFRVPPLGAKDLTLTKRLTTERRAIQVELLGCTAPGQGHPR